MFPPPAPVGASVDGEHGWGNMGESERGWGPTWCWRSWLCPLSAWHWMCCWRRLPIRSSWAKAVPCVPGRPGCGVFWWAVVIGRPVCLGMVEEGDSGDTRRPRAQRPPWVFQAVPWGNWPGRESRAPGFTGRRSWNSSPAGGGWKLHSAAKEEGTMATAPLCLPVDRALGSGWLWRMVAVPTGPCDQGWDPLEPVTQRHCCAVSAAQP